MAKSEDKKAVDIFTLPEGRVINQSLFVKDAFDERAVPSYKIEIAIPKDDPGIADLEDRLLDFADDRWGEGASDDENLVIPLLDGDKLAKKREKKGKDGDAYKGMIVIRANTIYNKEGQDGPGGIQVFDPDVEEILPARSSDVFSGCYGEVAVTIGTYEGDDAGPDRDEHFNGLKFYMSAFQKTKNGEKLVSSADRSTLFKPRGRDGGGESGGRKRRRSRG